MVAIRSGEWCEEILNAARLDLKRIPTLVDPVLTWVSLADRWQHCLRCARRDCWRRAATIRRPRSPAFLPQGDDWAYIQLRHMVVNWHPCLNETVHG